ncbi:MAG: S8 family serine peptidase [Phycisphaera sp.]|nr:S8 family serine peptidase [Phycisphaera sp.]
MQINHRLGAFRYYHNPISVIGQGTITTNIGAGHFWNGHETLQHVETSDANFIADPKHTWGGASVEAKYDLHPTWVSMMIGGRITSSDVPGGMQLGLAHGTDLRSCAIATSFYGDAPVAQFDVSATTLVVGGETSFGVSDTINSSWGFDDPTGNSIPTVVMDALSYRNPTTTLVMSSGDYGGDVIGPASGYNGITVGWLTAETDYFTPSEYSSRSPQEFGYIDQQGNPVVIAGPRAAVDITAPGDDLISAFYGGQTGGNNPTVNGSQDLGGNSNSYTSGLAGTSFSSPLVAGGASLITSAARTLPELSENEHATQSMVVKALLLNGATRTGGWDNGQERVSVAGLDYIRTTQSVDWAAGTGMMNLNRTFDLQTGGQIDVPGTNTGDLGEVDRLGWDYGQAQLGIDNRYAISKEIAAGTTMKITLTWMRGRSYVYIGPSPPAPPIQARDLAQADLDLSIWSLDAQGGFDTLIARSESLYNTVEHLVIELDESGRYGLMVEYPRNTFDNTDGDEWGDPDNLQPYGISWQAFICVGDLNNDKTVNAGDVGLLVSAWGTDGSSVPGSDADGDGMVGGADLAYVLGHWGPCSAQ